LDISSAAGYNGFIKIVKKIFNNNKEGGYIK
jgi:hypothetical protein